MNRQQLADAMIEGLCTPGMEESRNHYVAAQPLLKTCFACALGSALIGKLDGDFQEAEILYESKCSMDGLAEYEAFSELLDIPVALAIEVEHRHLNGQTIEEIAAWLKGGE